MNDITALVSVQKNANLHRLSRLIAYAPSDELRQMAVEVEQYTDRLFGALEHYKSREERVTKLVLDNSVSWEELFKQLEEAKQRNTELVEALEKATSEPVALRWRWNDNDAQWTYAPASKMPDFVAAGFSPENGVVIESLYTVPPALESRTVTVKLPPTFWYEHDDLAREVPVLDKRLVKKALRSAGIQVIEGEGQ